MQSNTPRILGDVLKNASGKSPEKGIYFVKNIESELFISYPALFQKAGNILFGLNQQNIRKGDKIILALNKNDEIIPVLWACFISGIIATILPPPVFLNDKDPSRIRLLNVYKLFKDAKIIVSHEASDKWDNNYIPSDSLILLSSITSCEGNLPEIVITESDVAYIQFSSGSIGEPKGVRLTHKNIITNLDSIKTGLDINDNDFGGNWMPLFHDMGMIGFHLTPIYATVNFVLIETSDFIRKPLLFLDVLDKYKVTITGGTNFSQILILKALDRNLDRFWDLSNVKAILNGAEPISVELMNRFISKLQSSALKPGAMMPVYGLAEASLAVTFTQLNKTPTIISFDRTILHTEKKAVPVSGSKTKSITLVSVGKVLKNCMVRVVDDKSNPLEDGMAGHIQIKGENVTIGYLNSVQDDYFVDKWFKTGDMGFLYNDELFITGRFKDIIFLNGQNFYASDLENIALQVEGIIDGKVFICGVHDEKTEEETPLLFLSGFEISKSIAFFIRISRLIRSVTGINIQTFILIKSNQIPKTTSGKIQRHKLITMYINGEFDEIISKINELIPAGEAEFQKDKIGPSTKTEKLLHNLWCHFLSRYPREIGIDDTFYEAGGNSLGAVELLMELKKNYNISIDYSVLAENRTIRKLAQFIDEHPSVYQVTQVKKKRFGG